jgi:hypothetical protein
MTTATSCAVPSWFQRAIVYGGAFTPYRLVGCIPAAWVHPKYMDRWLLVVWKAHRRKILIDR